MPNESNQRVLACLTSTPERVLMALLNRFADKATPGKSALSNCRRRRSSSPQSRSFVHKRAPGQSAPQKATARNHGQAHYGGATRKAAHRSGSVDTSANGSHPLPDPARRLQPGVLFNGGFSDLLAARDDRVLGTFHEQAMKITCVPARNRV